MLRVCGCRCHAACVVVTIVAHRWLLCANILFSFNIDGCFLFEADFGSDRLGSGRIGLHAHRAIQSVIYVFI